MNDEMNGAVVETTSQEDAPPENAVPVNDTMANDSGVTGDSGAAQSVTSLRDLERKMQLTGTVTRLELYGAFIDVGLETEALVHISQLGTEHVNRVTDVLNVGDTVNVWVEKVDPARNQLMVTMIEPLAVEWSDLQKGSNFTGTVTRLENFGAFVDIGAEREGLVHISELSHDYVKHPSEVVSVGDEVQVQVLNFSKKKRRIDLSMKALMERPESQQPVYENRYDDVAYDDEDDEPEDLPTSMEIALRRAMGSDFKPPRKRGGKAKRQRRVRQQQEDILSRTLRTSDEE